MCSQKQAETVWIFKGVDEYQCTVMHTVHSKTQTLFLSRLNIYSVATNICLLQCYLIHIVYRQFVKNKL